MTSRFASEAEETRAALADAWAGLPAALRGPTQFLGRQYAGCGATIGAMPRCDFTCSGCYLGDEANWARPLPITEVKAQIAALRTWLGPFGNIQLTDGELTLRPAADLVTLIAHARAVGLVPMLMTHGETFRRKPGLLERLMTEGGLSEVCFHVDTTMRGRRDRYADAKSETDLDGLRAEFAAMIRTARQRTGRRLEAASTVTVTRHNLNNVPGIVRWFLVHADAFKMVSFQPVAAVGRTERGLGVVAADELWSRIAEGAGDAALRRGEGRLGHPACSRFVQGLAVRRTDGPVLVPLYRGDDAREMRFLGELLDRLGGTSFRLDGRRRALRRALHVLPPHAGFLLARGLPYLWRLARRVGTLRGRYFCIVSHHFMSAAEVATPLGRERLSACAFRVPIDGRLEPMCTVNAFETRARFYRSVGRAEPTAPADRTL
jgi:MoaA/NifB/PqqE/SkfB family radical SAM enzyme